MKSKRFAAVIAAVMVTVSSFGGSAFAAPNTFMDVPYGHWAYDAVEYLAASGALSGYPTGEFSGDKLATRYELASCVARSLEQVDMEKADAKTVELLKKLMIEFDEELTAMGAQMDKIDGRVAGLEEALGGWSINGSLTFDMNWGDDGNMRHDGGGRDWAGFRDSYIGLTKTFGDGSYVFTRFSMDGDQNGDKGDDVVIDRMYWQGWLGASENIGLTIGRFEYDWESRHGLYHPGENDGWFNHFVVDGFKGSVSLGASTQAEAVIGRNIDSDAYPIASEEDKDFGMYALMLNHYLSEGLYIGAFGSYLDDDNNTYLGDATTYGGWLSWEFIPGAAVRGLYYTQELDSDLLDLDNQDAWKAIIDVKQSVFGFTSLWAEYGQMDKNFIGTAPNAYNWSDGTYSSLYQSGIADADLLLVRADQKWNDKWGTFLRYAQAEYDLADSDTVKNWTVGVTYQMNPAIGFQLAYDEVDYGNMSGSFLSSADEDTDRLIRLRTTINF